VVRGGEPFGYVARLSGFNACKELEVTFDEVHNLVDAPLEECADMFVHRGWPSLDYSDVIPNTLDHSHVSTFYS